MAKLQDMEWYSSVPRSIKAHAIFGFTTMVIAFGGFGAWAFTAPLSSAVIAQGSFVAIGQNKVVQHLEGGIIQDILVEEGDHVEKGQPLIHLDRTAASARDREFHLRRARLEAINARLAAEAAGKEKVVFPEYLEEQRQDYEILRILNNQMLNFQTARARLEREKALLQNNIDALDFRAGGFKKQKIALQKQLFLLNEEHVDKQKLYDRGLLRKTSLAVVKRAIAEAMGQVGRLESEISEISAQLKKEEDQIRQAVAAARQVALDEQQSIAAELDSVREQARSAENVLKRSTINAPVSGTVVRMHYNTSGGVIETGKSILEILPTGVPLMIEAQVPRIEIENIHKGQKASIRLTALNRRTTPVLNGEVFYVSADSLPATEGRSQRDVYLTRINLPVSELKRVPGFSPTPGMPTEILIQAEERTFFAYLTKPIADSMSRAFRER